MGTTHEMLRMGEKNSHNRKQLWEDGIKLEVCIFGRTGKDWRGTLLRSSKLENDDEKHHHELLRYSGRMKRVKVEPTMKNNTKSILENIWLMKFILTSNLEMNLRIAPDNSKSQVRSWEKTCGLGPTQKENTVWTIDWNGGIAPVELNGLNEITTSK